MGFEPRWRRDSRSARAFHKANTRGQVDLSPLKIARIAAPLILHCLWGESLNRERWTINASAAQNAKCVQEVSKRDF